MGGKKGRKAKIHILVLTESQSSSAKEENEMEKPKPVPFSVQISLPVGRLCPSPSAIDHGQHNGEDVKLFVPGKSVNYSCDPGYSLIGKTTLHCMVNGSWSIPYPWCEGELSTLYPWRKERPLCSHQLY